MSKIAAWLKPRSDPNGKGDEKTGSVKEELPKLTKEKTGSVKEPRSELAKEKALEQKITKRKSRMNKK